MKTQSQAGRLTESCWGRLHVIVHLCGKTSESMSPGWLPALLESEPVSYCPQSPKAWVSTSDSYAEWDEGSSDSGSEQNREDYRAGSLRREDRVRESSEGGTVTRVSAQMTDNPRLPAAYSQQTEIPPNRKPSHLGSSSPWSMSPHSQAKASSGLGSGLRLCLMCKLEK